MVSYPELMIQLEEPILYPELTGDTERADFRSVGDNLAIGYEDKHAMILLK